MIRFVDMTSTRTVIRPTSRLSLCLLPAWIITPLVLVGPALAQQPDTASGTSAVAVPSGATIESLYKDFLHYARMGRFQLADAYAKSLLSHPELDPVKVLAVADQDRKSLATLQIIIKNSSIRDSAAQVLKLLDQGENRRAQAVSEPSIGDQRRSGRMPPPMVSPP